MSTDDTDRTLPLPAAEDSPADDVTPTETIAAQQAAQPEDVPTAAGAEPVTRPEVTPAAGGEAPTRPTSDYRPPAPAPGPTPAPVPAPAPAPATPPGPELRVGTVVWGLVVAVVGIGIVSFAWGARIDGGLALIVLLAGAGVALLAGSLVVAVRRPHRRERRG